MREATGENHPNSQGPPNGGVSKGGFPDLDLSFLFCPFLSFSGTFPLCSGMVRGLSRFVPCLFLGLLRAPTRNSPERVRDTIWTFPEESGKHPGLETPRFSFSQDSGCESPGHLSLQGGPTVLRVSRGVQQFSGSHTLRILYQTESPFLCPTYQLWHLSFAKENHPKMPISDGNITRVARNLAFAQKRKKVPFLAIFAYLPVFQAEKKGRKKHALNPGTRVSLVIVLPHNLRSPE